MKQQRVKLMNQIKDDAEQFRKLKQDMAKEVLQLKSQVGHGQRGPATDVAGRTWPKRSFN